MSHPAISLQALRGSGAELSDALGALLKEKKLI